METITGLVVGVEELVPGPHAQVTGGDAQPLSDLGWGGQFGFALRLPGAREAGRGKAGQSGDAGAICEGQSVTVRQRGRRPTERRPGLGRVDSLLRSSRTARKRVRGN